MYFMAHSKNSGSGIDEETHKKGQEEPRCQGDRVKEQVVHQKTSYNFDGPDPHEDKRQRL